MTAPLRVLVADDHPVFRTGIRTLLELSGATEVVGEVSDGAAAVAAARELRPDVVLMDVQMPGLNGIDATRQIVEAHPDVRVLVLTMFEDDESVFAAMRAGARGYLLKDSEHDQIVRGVQAVGHGEAIFGPTIARRMVEFLSVPPHRRQSFPELTDREREVLELIAAGWSNQRIAQHFVLSNKTIRNHVSNVFAKLRVADRDHAIDLARGAGLGHLP